MILAYFLSGAYQSNLIGLISKNVLVYGAGEAGKAIISSNALGQVMKLILKVFIDDDISKQGYYP